MKKKGGEEGGVVLLLGEDGGEGQPQKCKQRGW